MDLLIGIDVGTTSCKATVVSPDGTELAHGQRATPWATVPTGAEIDPVELAETALEATMDALDAAPEGIVRGVGVCGMGETGVMLDEHGDPLAPGIAWHDTRGQAGSEAMARELGADRFVRHTGLPVSASWTAPKIEALKTEHPEIVRGRRWLSVAEWVVKWLGGEEVAELSLASRTGFLDIGKVAWWPESLERLSLSVDVMPPLVRAGTPSGRVRRVAAMEGAVLTVAGHDHPCATVGAGAYRPGDVLDSCGTAEAIVASIAAPAPPATIDEAAGRGITIGCHVVPERMVLLGFFKAGLALRTFLDVLGVAAVGEARDQLDREALAASTGTLEVGGIAEDLHRVIGVGAGASRGALWRATQVAAARETARILAEIQGLAGPHERLVATGGWTRSETYRRIKREVLGAFEVPAVDEAGARGAALFGGMAAGLFAGVEDFPPLIS